MYTHVYIKSLKPDIFSDAPSDVTDQPDYEKKNIATTSLILEMIMWQIEQNFE